MKKEEEEEEESFTKKISDIPLALKSISELKTENIPCNKKISLLKYWFSYYRQIINNYYFGVNGMYFLTSGIDVLNNSFIIIRKKIIEIIDGSPELLEIKNSNWYIESILSFNDLYVSIDFLDTWWDKIELSLLNIKTDIDKIDFELNFGKEFLIEDIFKEKEDILYMIMFENLLKVEIENMDNIYQNSNFLNLNGEKKSEEKTDDNLKVNTKILKLKGKKNFPEKLNWKQIKIIFQDDEYINLWIDDTLFGTYSFIEFKMGKAKPTRLWTFLKMISNFNLKEFKDKSKIPDLTNLLLVYKSKEEIEKIVSDLNRKLKELFNQTENPFYDYKLHKQYKTKFSLNPESIDNYKKDTFNSESLDSNSDHNYL